MEHSRRWSDQGQGGHSMAPPAAEILCAGCKAAERCSGGPVRSRDRAAQLHELARWGRPLRRSGHGQGGNLYGTTSTAALVATERYSSWTRPVTRPCCIASQTRPMVQVPTQIWSGTRRATSTAHRGGRRFCYGTVFRLTSCGSQQDQSKRKHTMKSVARSSEQLFWRSQ